MSRKLDPVMLTIAVRTARGIVKDASQNRHEARGGLIEAIRAESYVIAYQLRDFGFSVTDNFTGYAVAFGNVRATSTGGLHGAVNNWISAVERKIGEAAS